MPCRLVKGAITVSGPIVTPASMTVAAGIDDGHPGELVADVDARLGQGGDLGQLAAVVDLRELLLVGDLIGLRGALAGAQDRDHVGQVVLALGVVGPDLGQGLSQGGTLEGEHARVDLADVALELGRVPVGLGLDHLLDRSVRAPHDAAVTGGVVEDHRGDGRRGAAALVRLEHRPQRVGLDQRRVPVEHEHGAGLGELPGGGANGVGGTERPLLHDGDDVLVQRIAQPPLGRVDHDDPADPGLTGRGHRPADDRPPAQRVQQL